MHQWVVWFSFHKQLIPRQFPSQTKVSKLHYLKTVRKNVLLKLRSKVPNNYLANELRCEWFVDYFERKDRWEPVIGLMEIGANYIPTDSESVCPRTGMHMDMYVLPFHKCEGPLQSWNACHKQKAASITAAGVKRQGLVTIM